MNVVIADVNARRRCGQIEKRALLIGRAVFEEALDENVGRCCPKRRYLAQRIMESFGYPTGLATIVGACGRSGARTLAGGAYNVAGLGKHFPDSVARQAPPRVVNSAPRLAI